MQYTRAEIYMKRFISSYLYLLELFLCTYSLHAQQDLVTFDQEWEDLWVRDIPPMPQDLTITREYYRLDRHYIYKIPSLVLDLECYNQTASFPCPLCQTYTATRSKNLLQHIRNAHIPAYPFYCKFPGCNKEEKSSSNLSSHIRKKHPMIPTNLVRTYMGVHEVVTIPKILIQGSSIEEALILLMHKNMVTLQEE